MTREEAINEAVKTSITETLMSTPNYEFSPKATDMLECAFTKGAEWADAHPKNPWHNASEELSWQDIRKIVTIADDIADFDTYRNRDTGEEEYYSEVLRKFNEEQRRKEQE